MAHTPKTLRSDAPLPRLAFTPLNEHLATDKSFLSAYARTLAAIAVADKTVSLADFEALTDVARSSHHAALMGALILQSLEQRVELSHALTDLAKAQHEADEKECAAAFLMAKPLLLLQGHHARPIARRLADALKHGLSDVDLNGMPEEEQALGLIDTLSAKARRLVKGKDVGDFLVEFGRSIGDLDIISRARAFQNGTVSRQALNEHFALTVARIENDITQYRKRAKLAQGVKSAVGDSISEAKALKHQIDQRLAIIAARVRHEREAFSEDIEDLVHDAGNAIENSVSDRLKSDKWKDKDVWASIARTDFGMQAERRISRAVRRREEVLRLLKEELKLFQSDLRVVQASIIGQPHHAELAQLMPQMRFGTRFVNAVDSAANLTLGAGSVAVAGTGAAAYLLGSAVVLPFVAPAAPFLAGVLAAAGLFKWFSDSDKRKISEIGHKRRAIEDVVRQRLTEAATSFNTQIDQVEADFKQSAVALLNPILLDAEAARQLHAMHQRIATQIIDQSEVTMKKLAIQLQ
jgi:hypothetical protein